MTAVPRCWVKICGITCLEDAESAVQAGADAIGLNFVRSSRRCIDADTARSIARAVRGRVEVIGVFADESPTHLESMRARIGLDWLQLHGNETPEEVALLPRAFKAVGVTSAASIEQALRYPGERLLLDSKSGGSGTRFDWSLLAERHIERPFILAGGLTPESVHGAIAMLNPFGVDVASGVECEGDARRKDGDKVARFVRAARE